MNVWWNKSSELSKSNCFLDYSFCTSDIMQYSGTTFLKKKNHMTYFPKPADTSAVHLSPDLTDLIEKLAENAHDHWARKRIDEGRHYGKERNDTARTHPDLIPYEELPESEKEYDRKTVVEVLKTIISLGYEIKKTS
jgi:hypothetical protein